VSYISGPDSMGLTIIGQTPKSTEPPKPTAVTNVGQYITRRSIRGMCALFAAEAATKKRWKITLRTDQS